MHAAGRADRLVGQARAGAYALEGVVEQAPAFRAQPAPAAVNAPAVHAEHGLYRRALEGGPPDAVLEIGIGLQRLEHEDIALDSAQGILASWGMQTPEIGTIGLGVVFPPRLFVRYLDAEDRHCVVLRAQTGAPLRYHIQATWLRGRHFPCRPTLDNWLQELRATAACARREGTATP